MIYFMLILPVLLVLSLKMAPVLFERKGANGKQNRNETEASSQSGYFTHDEIEQIIGEANTQGEKILPEELETIPTKVDTISKTVVNKGSAIGEITPVIGKKSPFERTFSFLFQFVILFTVVAGLIINAPLKKFFIRKRRRKPVTDKLHTYCRKLLLYTPYINSGLLFLSFLVMHGFMVYMLVDRGNFEDILSRNLFQQFFYISLVATLLLVLFVFFWQKHRVNIIYLEHVFSEEELHKRQKVFLTGKIQNRLLVSSAMTTLLPLTIVLLYLVLSLTPVKDLGNMTPEQTEIIIGPYKSLISGIKFDSTKDLDSMYYVNAIDNILMFTGIGMGILVALIYIVFFVRWTTASILRPVEELLQNMRLTSGFQINNYTVVRSSDEIGELSEGYNHMTRRLVDYIDTISCMNEAYVRFVPREFLQILGKESFTDVTLGDQVQKEMTVVFSDIRSFSEMSEEMTPKENFDFINHYLGLMEPIFSRNNGFIDKYIGDSIMALFSESVDDAINAAIEMCIELRNFNAERRAMNKNEIDVGIGIHTGTLMLGIIGGKGRIDGTVISDAVNLASRLEGLTKTYGATIIVSEDALLKIRNKEKYKYRFLDVARVKGKRKSVNIFEILNGEPEEIQQGKLETQEIFQQAVEQYRNMRFDDARTHFEKITVSNPGDRVARLYAKRCSYYQKHGIPHNWAGAE